ncbi:hypothetical protein HDU97_009031 [Phlyctochytrium planicorne]|nr:hypothetical protein HDU97_009031 [Phlyctochytrium planicorne]
MMGDMRLPHYSASERVAIALEASRDGPLPTGKKYGLDLFIVMRWVNNLPFHKLVAANESQTGDEATGDKTWAEAAQEAIDNKTKPPHSLGFLENWSVQLMILQQTLSPKIEKGCILLFAADHGVADEDVSQYPKAVTAEMLRNLSNGGAAINAICNSNGLDLIVTDVGVDTAEVFKGIEVVKACKGSRSILDVSGAMTPSDLSSAINAGDVVAQNAISKMGYKNVAIGLGELGIANTTIAATLLLAAIQYRGRNGIARQVAGKGTGITDERLEKKIDVIQRAVDLHRDACMAIDSPAERWEEVMRRLGGLEIAAMASAARHAAIRRCAVIVDGFISSVSFLMALLMFPEDATFLHQAAFFSHQSMEKGANMVFREIENVLGVTEGSIKPALSMDLRLGEGTGAALAFPILKAAAHVASDMQTFSQAAVSGSK